MKDKTCFDCLHYRTFRKGFSVWAVSKSKARIGLEVGHYKSNKPGK
jgi:hypothetical protein